MVEAGFQISPAAEAITPDSIKTSLPSASVPVVEEDFKVTPAELAFRLNYASNYCASSSAEAYAKCAKTLRTCNHDDPPCGIGTACWEHVVCSIVWSDIEFGSANEEVGSLEAEPSKDNEEEGTLEVEASDDNGKEGTLEAEASNESPAVELYPFLSTVSCSGACLRPLSSNECTAGGIATSLADCLSVAVGEMCEHRGECGVGANIGNCPGGRDVFMRVMVGQCGPETTDSPSPDEGSWSLLPTMRVTPSLAPSSSSGHSFNDVNDIMNNDNSNLADDSSGRYGGSLGLPREEEDSRPGAWWKWYEPNGSTRLFTTPILQLLCYTIIVLAV